MSFQEVKKAYSKKKTIFTKCTSCNQVTESDFQPKRCSSCGKSMLPIGYLYYQDLSPAELNDLYCQANEIHEEDLVKGLRVIWTYK